MNKKVLILYPGGITELNNRGSALGSYVHCLASLLVKHGVEIWVNDAVFNPQSQHLNSTVQSSAGKLSFIKKLIPRFVKHIRNQRTRKANMQRIAGALPGESFDGVLEYYSIGSHLSSEIKKKYQCPYTIVLDSPSVEEYEFFNGKDFLHAGKNKQLLRNALQQATHVVVYNEPMRSYVAAITGKKNNVHIHQNVDFTRFDFIEPREITNETVIGFIGSFLSWHRVDLLLTVFERIKKEGSNVRLILLGAGQQYTAIATRVANSPFKSFITIPGFCDGETLQMYKRQMHIGVMPGSNWYGAPNKIFEYGAAGMAVVAPDTPAIKDLFARDETVQLFAWDNEEDFFLKLNELCANPVLLASQQKKLQQYVRLHYGEEQTLRFYQEVLF